MEPTIMHVTFDKGHIIEDSQGFKKSLNHLLKNQQLNFDSCQQLKKKLAEKRQRNAKRCLIVKVCYLLFRFVPIEVGCSFQAKLTNCALMKEQNMILHQKISCALHSDVMRLDKVDNLKH